ncbi:TetR/AcrR family transcriptional regulator [Polaromonas sp.]|uniref:TetR/AcrR family transcriptional regulator n=1 Tax=Polaromonas sp. TaxID=1869339 RepID=UPI0032675043
MSTAARPPAKRRAATPVRPDRRQNILLAAEKLFAKHGYHAVSIRHIADEAQVPLALVGYYFGAKHELYHAIFEHWSTTINERLAALALAMADESGDRLPRIVEAFIAPVIRLRASAEGEYYALLMTRGLALQSEEEDSIIREFFDPMARAFIEAFHTTLAAEFPATTQAQVVWCYQFALGALLHHIGDRRVHRLSQGENRPNDPAVMPQLVAFIAHGMRGAMLQSHPSAPARKEP